jgi:hypothetical protein
MTYFVELCSTVDVGANWCLTVNSEHRVQYEHSDFSAGTRTVVAAANKQLEDWGYSTPEEWTTATGLVFKTKVQKSDPTLKAVLGGVELSQLTSTDQLVEAADKAAGFLADAKPGEVFPGNWRVQLFQDDDRDWRVAVHNGTEWVNCYSPERSRGMWYSCAVNSNGTVLPVDAPTVPDYLKSKEPVQD